MPHTTQPAAQPKPRTDRGTKQTALATRTARRPPQVEYQHPAWRLPFAHRRIGGINYWGVPDAGGFDGGWTTGDAMARALLLHIRDGQRHGWMDPEGLLRLMLVDLVEHFGSVSESRRGQLAGFMNVIGKWVAAGVRECGAGLDRITEPAIEAQLNEGLARVDDEAQR
jgi:hypothetical protein